MSNAHEHDFTGDITLNGGEETPISVIDAENVYFRRNSVTGNVKLINPEYVFSSQRPTEKTVPSDDIETTVSGSIEDIYVPHNAIEGTIIIDGAQDVHIEPITDVTADIELIVSGWNNTIDITGRTAMVTVYLLGSQNTVRTSPYIDLETDIQAGVENTIEQEPVPASDIIETTRKEAYAGHLLGRDTVTFQEPATDRDYCPNCGANASAITIPNPKRAGANVSPKINPINAPIPVANTGDPLSVFAPIPDPAATPPIHVSGIGITPAMSAPINMRPARATALEELFP